MQNKQLIAVLVLMQLCTVLRPTEAVFGMSGFGSRSDVAEILAAGLITKMLMEDFTQMGSAPMIQSMRHQLSAGYPAMRTPIAHNPYHPLLAARVPIIAHLPSAPLMRQPARIPLLRHPMMNQLVTPVSQRHPLVLNQALLHQGVRHAAYPWSMSTGGSYMPTGLVSLPTFDDFMADANTLSVITLLLNSDLFDEDDEEDVLTKNSEEDELKPSEFKAEEYHRSSEDSKIDTIENKIDADEFQTASSESSERYILPRIVRHFVQRIMKRVESH